MLDDADDFSARHGLRGRFTPFFLVPFCPWRPQRFHVQAGQPDMRVTVDESLRLVSPRVDTYLCNAAAETLCLLLDVCLCVLAQISRLVLSSARSWFFQLGLIRRWPGVLGDGQPGCPGRLLLPTAMPSRTDLVSRLAGGKKPRPAPSGERWRLSGQP